MDRPIKVSSSAVYAAAFGAAFANALCQPDPIYEDILHRAADAADQAVEALRDVAAIERWGVGALP